MKFARYLREELIFLKLPYRSKRKVIEYLTRELAGFYKLTCEKEIIDNIVSRERVKSTGLAMGLAVPHGRIDMLDKLYVAFGRTKKGIHWGSEDKGPAHFIFLVVGPNKMVKDYLEILGQISRIMMRHGVREALKIAKTKKEVIGVIRASGIRRRRR